MRYEIILFVSTVKYFKVLFGITLSLFFFVEILWVKVVFSSWKGFSLNFFFFCTNWHLSKWYLLLISHDLYHERTFLFRLSYTILQHHFLSYVLNYTSSFTLNGTTFFVYTRWTTLFLIKTRKFIYYPLMHFALTLISINTWEYYCCRMPFVFKRHIISVISSRK